MAETVGDDINCSQYLRLLSHSVRDSADDTAVLQAVTITLSLSSFNFYKFLPAPFSFKCLNTPLLSYYQLCNFRVCGAGYAERLDTCGCDHIDNPDGAHLLSTTLLE